MLAASPLFSLISKQYNTKKLFLDLFSLVNTKIQPYTFSIQVTLFYGTKMSLTAALYDLKTHFIQTGQKLY